MIHCTSRALACALLATALATTPAHADAADPVYLPPQPTPAKTATPPRDTLLRWLAQPRGHWITTEFAAATQTRATTETRPGDQIAWHATTLPTPDELFAPAPSEPGHHLWLGEITSQGATALRLKAALTALAPADRLYLIEPDTASAHGPFHAAQGERWLPSTTGDSVLLALLTPEKHPPPLRITTLAHFFAHPTAKALPCPTPAACETDPAFQRLSTAIARLLIPIVGEGQFLCTATLLNAPETPELEPWIITAQHCIDGPVEVQGIEALWDYRAENCDGLNIPPLASLPRSTGAALLAENPCLDAALLALDTIPVAAHGRAWLGWDTQPPEPGDPIQMPHHPQGTPMKVSSGHITALNLDPCLDPQCADQRFRQLRARWDEGISEQGSSGAPALHTATAYRVIGMLSNGPLHHCDTPEANFDHFASFAAFYPEIQPWLRPQTGTTGEIFLCRDRCPLRLVFGDDATTTKALRTLRDRFLRGGPWETAYYAAAPRLCRAAATNPHARAIIATTALPFRLLAQL